MTSWYVVLYGNTVGILVLVITRECALLQCSVVSVLGRVIVYYLVLFMAWIPIRHDDNDHVRIAHQLSHVLGTACWCLSSTVTSHWLRQLCDDGLAWLHACHLSLACCEEQQRPVRHPRP
eukprot:scpid33621/ scgid13687/ 